MPIPPNPVPMMATRGVGVPGATRRCGITGIGAERTGWQHWPVVRPTHDALFVYGTLMPGHLRWPMLAPHALDQRPATVPGTLYDTGDGWPAAAFGLTPTARRVPGWVVWFPADVLDGLLGDLDAMEGIGAIADPTVDPYVRIRVPVDSVTDAWGYHATRTRSTWRVIDAWLDQPEA